MNYPKNTDVKNVRPSLGDRIDLALLEFPGRTALTCLALAVVIVVVVNLV
jgi:hypothetical protein